MHREPIILSPHAVAVIHVFTKDEDIEEIFAFDYLDFFGREASGSRELFRIAAREFISQLKGHYCKLFLEMLRDEITNILNN